MTHRKTESQAPEPRPLSEREREILAFLLSVDGPGMEELREQAEFVRARPWPCGCASIDLLVDQKRGRASPIIARPTVEAESRSREPKEAFDLILWVREGWLDEIELVEYGQSRHDDANIVPSPTAFGPPWLRPS